MGWVGYGLWVRGSGGRGQEVGSMLAASSAYAVSCCRGLVCV